MDPRALRAMLRMPSRREAIQTLAAALVIALICWYFGVDVWHSILLGCAITVIGLACLAAGEAPDARDLGWLPGKRERKAGSRNDVANLSASLRASWGYVGMTAEGRLKQIARRRLALEGLDLRNPDDRLAIEQRIGSTAYRALVHRRGTRRLSLRTLVCCLDMLDAIDSTHYPAPPARSRRPYLYGIRLSLGRARER